LGGGQSLYTWWRNREITSIPFADYLQKKPQGEWLELKGAILDLPSASTVEKRGKITGLYIPLRTSSTDESNVQVLLHTEDKQYVGLIEELKNKDQKAALEYVLKNGDRLWPVRDVRGVVEFGIFGNDRHREQLAKLNSRLASDFVTVEDGKQPNPWLGGGMLLGGLILLFTYLPRSVGRPALMAKDGLASP
jgi:hypothetical protein